MDPSSSLTVVVVGLDSPVRSPQPALQGCLMTVPAMGAERCQGHASSAPADFSGFKVSLKFSLQNAYIFDSLVYLIYFKSVLQF